MGRKKKNNLSRPSGGVTHQHKRSSGVGPVPEHLEIPGVHNLLRLGVHPHHSAIAHTEQHRLQLCAVQQFLSRLLEVGRDNEGERGGGGEGMAYQFDFFKKWKKKL